MLNLLLVMFIHGIASLYAQLVVSNYIARLGGFITI